MAADYKADSSEKSQRETNAAPGRLLKKWLMDWNTPCEAMCFVC